MSIENSDQRREKVLVHLSNEIKMLKMKNEIQSKVKVDIDKQQIEYLFNQQMRTIQEELGGNPVEAEIKEFEKRAAKKKLSKKIMTN